MKIDTSRDFFAPESGAERRSSERMRMDDVALYYKTQMVRFPLLAPQEERRLTSSYYENRDPATRDLLVHHNLRLAYSRALRFLGAGVMLNDLIQEGVIGLIKAIDGFDPAKGSRLITFAVYHIDNQIRLYIQEAIGMIFVPRRLQFLREKIKMKMMQEIGSQKQKEDSVASELGIDAKELRKVMTSTSFEYVSLSTPVGDKQESQLGDFITDSVHSNPFEVAMIRSELREALEEKAFVYGMLTSPGFVKKHALEIFLTRTGLVGLRGPVSVEVVSKEFEITIQSVYDTVNRIYAKLSCRNPRITKVYVGDLVRRVDALRAIVEAF